MAGLNWNESFSVNVKDFDRQHKHLFEILNELFLAMKKGKGDDIAAEILKELKNYTISHFKDEERNFEKHNYPEIETQKREHKYFIAQIDKYISELENKKIGLSIDILKFLGDWIQNHILVEDKKYSSFFLEKGVR